MRRKNRVGASTRGARAFVGARRRAAGRVVDRLQAADQPHAHASARPAEEAPLASAEDVASDAHGDVDLTPEQAEALAPLVRLWTWRMRQGLPPTPARTPPAELGDTPAPGETDPRTRLAIMFIERVKAGKVPGWSAGES